MSKTAIPWGRVAAETIAIVFAVLLALFLDDWRQEREQNEILASVSLSLRAELERNQRLLEARLPYHESLLDSLQKRVASPREPAPARSGSQSRSLPSLSDLGFAEGLGIDGVLATGAWQAAGASGAMPRMGVEELFLFSSAYTTQADVDSYSDRLVAKHEDYVLAAVEGQHPAFALISFTSALSELVEREQILCDTYRTLARRLTGSLEEAESRCGSGHVTIR